MTCTVPEERPCTVRAAPVQDTRSLPHLHNRRQQIRAQSSRRPCQAGTRSASVRQARRAAPPRARGAAPRAQANICQLGQDQRKVRCRRAIVSLYPHHDPVIRAGGHLPAGPGPAQGEHAGARVLHGDQAQVQAGHPVARHAARPAAGAACLKGHSCGAGVRRIGARNACRHAYFPACGVVALGAGARARFGHLAMPGPLYSQAPLCGWRPTCC
jgi:hypothetical protein